MCPLSRPALLNYAIHGIDYSREMRYNIDDSPE